MEATMEALRQTRPGGNPGWEVKRLREQLAAVMAENAALRAAVGKGARGARKPKGAPGVSPYDEFRGREWEAEAKYPEIREARERWQSFSTFAYGMPDYMEARREYLRLLYGTTVESKCREMLRAYIKTERTGGAA